MVCLRNFAHGNKLRHKSDHGRVERVEALIEFYPEGFGSIKWSGNMNENLYKVNEYAPVMRLIGIGVRGAGKLATKAKMIAFGTQSAETGYDVA